MSLYMNFYMSKKCKYILAFSCFVCIIHTSSSVTCTFNIECVLQNSNMLFAMAFRKLLRFSFTMRVVEALCTWHADHTEWIHEYEQLTMNICDTEMLFLGCLFETAIVISVRLAVSSSIDIFRFYHYTLNMCRARANVFYSLLRSLSLFLFCAIVFILYGHSSNEYIWAIVTFPFILFALTFCFIFFVVVVVFIVIILRFSHF